jgi:glycine cleavage system H protein
VPIVRGFLFPDHLLYHPESMTWVVHDVANDVVTLGLSALAIATAGEFLVFAARPLGALIEVGRAIGNVETAKIVSSVRTPIAGRLIAANEAIEADGTLIGRDPYAAWLVRIEPQNWLRDQANLIAGTAVAAAIEAEFIRHQADDDQS